MDCIGIGMTVKELFLDPNDNRQDRTSIFLRDFLEAIQDPFNFEPPTISLLSAMRKHFCDGCGLIVYDIKSKKVHSEGPSVVASLLEDKIWRAIESGKENLPIHLVDALNSTYYLAMKGEPLKTTHAHVYFLAWRRNSVFTPQDCVALKIALSLYYNAFQRSPNAGPPSISEIIPESLYGKLDSGSTIFEDGLNALGEVIVIVRMDGTVVWMNKLAKDALGMGHLDEGWQWLVDSVHPHDVDSVLASISLMKGSRQSVTSSSRFIMESLLVSMKIEYVHLTWRLAKLSLGHMIFSANPVPLNYLSSKVTEALEILLNSSEDHVSKLSPKKVSALDRSIIQLCIDQMKLVIRDPFPHWPLDPSTEHAETEEFNLEEEMIPLIQESEEENRLICLCGNWGLRYSGMKEWFKIGMRLFLKAITSGDNLIVLRLTREVTQPNHFLIEAPLESEYDKLSLMAAKYVLSYNGIQLHREEGLIGISLKSDDSHDPSDRISKEIVSQLNHFLTLQHSPNLRMITVHLMCGQANQVISQLISQIPHINISNDFYCSSNPADYDAFVIKCLDKRIKGKLMGSKCDIRDKCSLVKIQENEKGEVLIVPQYLVVRPLTISNILRKLQESIIRLSLAALARGNSHQQAIESGKSNSMNAIMSSPASTTVTPTCLDLAARYPLRIMVVEDSLVNLNLLVKIMQKHGFEEVVPAANGLIAVEKYVKSIQEGKEVDFIFMDKQMPELDGCGASKRIRSLSLSRKRPLGPHIVALTANGFSEDKNECLEAGMCDFTVKPLQWEFLESIMRDGYNAVHGFKECKCHAAFREQSRVDSVDE